MHDIMQEVERRKKCWNERFTACWKGKYTQEELAAALNKKYNTNTFKQESINRWMKIGEDGGLLGFPTYETMLKIANFFHVDVGYLTGETDGGTYEEGKAQAYLHLSTKAINRVREITGSTDHLSSLSAHPLKAQELLNNFIMAKRFERFMMAMLELSDICNEPNPNQQKWENAKIEYGIELINTVIDHLDDNEGDCFPELYSNPEFIKARDTISVLFDEGYNNQCLWEERYDARRYELFLEYQKLIEELFSKSSRQW